MLFLPVPQVKSVQEQCAEAHAVITANGLSMPSNLSS